MPEKPMKAKERRPAVTKAMGALLQNIINLKKFI
jgi:hypothetical protein